MSDADDNGHESAEVSIRCHDDLRLLLIANAPVRFTPLEYRLVRLMVQHLGRPVSFDALSRAAFGSGAESGPHATLEKHLDRIRTKLRAHGLAVLGVTTFGCVLLPLPETGTR